MAKILIAEDDPSMLAVLVEALKELNHEIITANNADRAFDLVQSQDPDLVLTDIEMPEGQPKGLELLRSVKERDRAIPVVVLTGYATKERAITALRAGAQDFIEKPFHIDELLKRVENAILQSRAERLARENTALKINLRDKFRFDNIVGDSPRMEAVYRMMERVAKTDVTVLILGESGTGKELVAKALHYNSRRAAMPFVAVNCAALPEHLLESELFGHRKGAFTGAAFDKVGLFQHADGGTIFLDEIASMALGLQSKLLRFLQDHELRRVGDTDTIKVDVRIIAATNEPLQKKLEDKTFREDLFYRISVIPIELPPLRERTSDVPLLAQYFLQTIAQRSGTPPPAISDEVMAVLHAYRWPGNVRELQNAMERASALCNDGIIALYDLPERILRGVGKEVPPPAPAPSLARLDAALVEQAAAAAHGTPGLSAQSLKDFIHQQEVRFIQQAIAACGGDKEKAAASLDVSMATLYRKLAPPSVEDAAS
ncbi:MAG: sigma-54-dependent Fis family transcriptional regulator [Verrucomicrobia bacterium]|nr:sigma-54-dependent Fis family transcriptional regulator [Verrucomicrobiota bacterium]